jgi:outer membrane protein OmpA-like peptidoglycan-associated protein
MTIKARMRSSLAALIACVLIGAMAASCSGAASNSPEGTSSQGANAFPTTSQSSGTFPSAETGRTDDTFAVPEITSTIPTTLPTTTTTTLATTTTTCSPRVIEIQGDVLFDTDQWVLKATAEETLVELAAQIGQEAENPDFRIVGYTDSRGTESYNAMLSEQRARAVYEWFVADGFDPDRITYEGLGESDLKVPDVDADGNFIESAGAENRRVVIYVSSTEGCP